MVRCIQSSRHPETRPLVRLTKDLAAGAQKTSIGVSIVRCMQSFRHPETRPLVRLTKDLAARRTKNKNWREYSAVHAIISSS